MKLPALIKLIVMLHTHMLWADRMEASRVMAAIKSGGCIDGNDGMTLQMAEPSMFAGGDCTVTNPCWPIVETDAEPRAHHPPSPRI